MIQIDTRTGMIVSGSLAVLIMAFLILAFVDNAQVLGRRAQGPRRPLEAPDVIGGRDRDLVTASTPLDPVPVEPGTQTGDLVVIGTPPSVLQFPLDDGSIYVLPVPEWMDVRFTTPPPTGDDFNPYHNLARDLEFRVSLRENVGDDQAPTGMMRVRQFTSMPVRVLWQDAFLASVPIESGPGNPATRIPGEGWDVHSVQRFFAEHYLSSFIGMYAAEIADRSRSTLGPGMALPEDLRRYYFGRYYEDGWYAMTLAEKIARGYMPVMTFRDGRALYRDSQGEGYYDRNLIIEDGHGLHFAQGARYMSRESGNLDITGAKKMEALAIYYACVFPWSGAWYNPTTTMLDRFIWVENLWNEVYWMGARGGGPLRDQWESMGLALFGVLDDYGDLYRRRREMGWMP